MQRTQGAGRLSVRQLDGHTRLADLYQQGSANYRVIMKWNAADNYQMTIPRLAAEIRKRIK